MGNCAVRICVFWAVMLAMGVNTIARGQTFAWNNASGGTFATGSNWTPIGPPNTVAATADFNLNAIYTVTIGTPATVGSLNFAAGLVSIQELAGGTSLFVANQVLVSSSATISFGTFACGSLNIQSGGKFTANMPGGPICGQFLLANGGTYSGNLSLGAFLPQTFTMNGGMYTTTGGLSMGGANAGTFVQNSGSCSLPVLSMSQSGAAPSNYFLGGGSIVTNATRLGGTAAATFTQSGGTHQCSTLSLASGARYLQSGGVLNVANVFSIDPGASLNFNAGNVQFNNSSNATLSVRGSFVQTGSGTLVLASSVTFSVDGAVAIASFSQTPSFNSGRMLQVINGGSFATSAPLDVGVAGSFGRIQATGVASRLTATGDSHWGDLGQATVTFSDSAAGTINGAVTLGASATNAGTLDVLNGATLQLAALSIGQAGRASVTGATLVSTGTVALAGQLNLSAGTLRASHLQLSGGSFNWNSGTLAITAGGAAVGGGGVLAANLLLDGTRSLTVAGTTVINPGARLTLDNSTLSTGGLVNNGSLTLISGVLNITGPGGLAVGPGAGVGSILTLSRGVSANVTSQLGVLAGGTLDVVGTSLNLGGGANAGKINIVDAAVNFGAGIAGSGTLNIVDSAVAGRVNGSTGSALNVGGNTTLQPTALPHRTERLSVAAGGRLDLMSGAIVIDYAGGSPFSTIASLIQTGYAGGAWTGEGINSSAAASQSGRALGFAESAAIGSPATFLGQPVDSSALLVRYTLYGDADLTGAVDLDDFTRLAASFGLSSSWSSGDFNYDGVTNLDDFTALAADFGMSAPSTVPVRAGPGLMGNAVPEPGTSPLLVFVGFALRRRRAVESRPFEIDRA